MGYGKLDDRYGDTRKIKRAWRRNRAAVGLHSMSIAHCNLHETDGLVDLDWLEEKLPDPDERREVLAVLVDEGLYHPTPDGDAFVLHDFLEHNRSRAAREELRQAKVDAGRKGGSAPRKKSGKRRLEAAA